MHNAAGMPNWLRRDAYGRDMTLEDLSYEVWVRANYVRRGAEPGKPIFLTFSKNEPREREICILFSSALPVSIEDYQEFLTQNFHFREHYAEQKKSWSCVEPGSALHIFNAADSSIMEHLSLMPELAPLNPVRCGVLDIFERRHLCSPNLECSDEEIIGELRKYLKALRQQDVELLLLAKGVANISGVLGDDPVWNGGKLLALFDLLYWKNADPTLTYTQIGSTIWFDDPEGVRCDQRIARIGIPLIEKIFSVRVAKTLDQEHVSKTPKESNAN
jgi:hypothetical protein